MERGVCRRGKIADLAALTDAQVRALEYDLMTKVGRTLDDVPDLVSYSALASFMANLGEDSVLWRSMHPEYGGWTSTQAMLADIVDWSQEVTRCLVALGGKRPKALKPYPRPWVKDSSVKRIGSDPVTVEEFERFWAQGSEDLTKE